MVEERTLVLGLANDSASINPSIFNDVSRHLELTEHIQLMLKMFDDTRITAGMQRELAIAMGKTILNEIRPECGLKLLSLKPTKHLRCIDTSALQLYLFDARNWSENPYLYIG